VIGVWILVIAGRAAARLYAGTSQNERAELSVIFLGAGWWCYVILLLGSSFLLGRGYPFDGRILSPLFVLAVPVFFISVRKSDFVNNQPLVIIIGHCFAFVALFAGSHVHKFATTHVGFGPNDWRHSPTIAAVRDLPKNITIYSNSADAIYLFADRDAIWLPYQLPGEFTRGSIHWHDIGKCTRRFQEDLARGAIVAFFDSPSHGLQTMKREEFLAKSGVVVQKEYADGFVGVAGASR
jgi:hypothetical protein